MTDKPTDKELKAMWQLHAADIGGVFDFARAVLAKWGAPAPVGVEPVAYSVTCNGRHVGNVFSNQEKAAGFMREMNRRYPQDSRAVVTLVAPPRASQPAQQEPLSNAEISAWAERHDINGTPLSLRCIVEDAASLRPTPPQASQPAQDAVDDLQGAATWLCTAIDGCDVADIQQRLSIGYNRAKRLLDASIAAQKGKP